ncbi:hypothetical protein FRC12_013244 [Ceratobasidium sp. 428]|nr:hypothetical protein FRC12_013244 [Ceratobasidium sp. 428]
MFIAEHGTLKRHTSRPLHELADDLKPASKVNGNNGVSEKLGEETTDADADDGEVNADAPASAAPRSYSPASLADRAKHAPLRPTLPERKILRLLEDTLRVSGHTDRMDILSYSTTRTERAAAQIRELVRSYLTYISPRTTRLFARVFEIGRRHKVMNPDELDTRIVQQTNLPAYGRSNPRHPTAAQILYRHSHRHSPLNPCYHGALPVLDDPRMITATREIPSPPNATSKARAEVQRKVKEKKRAVEVIVVQYAGREMGGRAIWAARRAERKETEKPEAGASLSNPEVEAEKDKTLPPESITPDLLRQCI